MKTSLKLLALILCLCLLLPCAAFAAPETGEDEAYEMIANGGAERVGADGFAASWWFTGDNIKLSEESAHTGTRSIHAIAKDKESICQKVNGLVGGSTCTFSVWVKVMEGTPSFYTKFEIRDIGNEYLTDSPIVGYVTHTAPAKRRWQKITYEFKMPAKADNGYFYIRFMNDTNMMLDDISLKGAVNASQSCTFVDIPEGSPNLIENGGYENYTPEAGADKWQAYLGWDGGQTTVVRDEARGNNVLMVQSDGSTNPWGRQGVKVEPMAVYQTTSLLKTVEMTGSIKYKFEFFADEKKDISLGYSEAQSPYFNATYGTWQKVGTTVDIPAFATYMEVYMRLYGGGMAYFDDVEVHKVSNPPRMYASVSAFNYVDNEIGIAAVRPNTISYETPVGSTVEFEIYDGTTLLDSYKTRAVGDTRWEFKVATLPEKDAFYDLKMTLKDGDGNVLDSTSRQISKVDRPRMLNKDGTFTDKNGKKITPVVGYHIGTLDNLDECADMGINVVQWNPGGAVGPLLDALDKAEELGMYIAVLLYDNGKPAGHESNIQKTTNIINACKDHPAVFAWMVQDEAYWANPNCYPDLFDSYKLIHSLDKDHPVYLLETSEFFAIEVAGTCDYYISDAYVYTDHLRKVSDLISRDTIIGDKLGRPHLSILQAMNYGTYDPDSNGMRHQSYQAFFANADSVGYYPVNAEMGNDDLWKTKRYEGIKAFDLDEIQDAKKAFVTEEYPTFSEASGRNLNVWHKLYVKDGELYMILLNLSDTEKMEADIPLASGGVTIGEFTAEAVDISGADAVSGNGRFKATLEPAFVAKYKITPAVPVDYSLLAQNLYLDLEDYAWAEEAIETLGVIEIIEGTKERTFSPADAITRGDFAKWLVRTLGLSADAKDNFADVPEDSRYAKEIAVGKALGILNGVGEGSFAPEATITRQDLMTIVARALEYMNNLEAPTEDFTTSFSDADKIADYAKSRVSEMICNGIITGNPDGTINPLGNTTRAEAAVIMYRLYDYKAFTLNPQGIKA